MTGVGWSGEPWTRQGRARRGAQDGSRAPAAIHSEHAYRFPTTPDVLWAALADVGAYPGWWPWLRAFDGRALATGDVWRCTICPPVPYAIRCSVEVTVVAPRSLVAALVTGDVVGEARLAIGPAPHPVPTPAAATLPEATTLEGTTPEGTTPDGAAPAYPSSPATEVRISSRLVARSAPVRMASRLVPWVAHRGHDWVFATAARQFGAAQGWPPG